MLELKPDHTLTDSLKFPEGPRWRDGRLFVSDMGSQRVVAISPDGESETVVDVPESPSGLGWLPDGRLLIASMNDRKLFRLEAGRLVEHADLSQTFAYPANDMVVDSKGRAYVGNFGFSLAQGITPAPTCMAMVGTDGTVEIAATDLIFPNGTLVLPTSGDRLS